jgi:pyruvate,water dikinase
MRQDKVTKTTTFTIRPRQLTGQAASEGLARGRARIIREPQDTFEFKAGEILVCDAIDPNMTFIVPLAAGIVERRGGMLIHGAIIAREYGIPCITGVPNAVDLIENGHEILVDGYLGIVTIEKKAARSIKSENTKSLKKK